MTVFKCKMCGANLKVSEGDTIVTCDYCRSQQTLPKIDNDDRARLYDRANHFRRNNEFDKAMEIYEEILNEDNSDAEAYWSIVLCRYGIEYVEDPQTHLRKPTINRAQYTSVFDDDNYISAIKYADPRQKVLYEKEAKEINEIQKGFLEISQNEEPFDVFICYKETDERGMRTRDSVYANELYHELTEEGFKVFYARITLEDKLGVAYEPYIFSALNSAKVMVVIGTKPEYFNAVWVRNEWSRFLGLIKNGAKKSLIPAYSGMDPYDLPREFAHLQAQDMTKLGFMPDLVRGIKKLTSQDTKSERVVVETVAASSADVSKLLKRASIFLEDSDWSNADIYCEKALDMDPENAYAYIYKLCGQLHCSKESRLGDGNNPLDNYNAYKKALRYADEQTAERLMRYNNAIKERRARIDEELSKEKAERDRLAAIQKAKDEAEKARKAALMPFITERNKLTANISYLQGRRRDISNNLNIAKANQKAFLENRGKSMALAIISLIMACLLWVSLICVAVFSSIAMEATIPFIVIFGICFYVTPFIFGVFSKINSTENGCMNAFKGGFLAYFTLEIYTICRISKNLPEIKKDAFAPQIEQMERELVNIDSELASNEKKLAQLNTKIASAAV